MLLYHLQNVFFTTLKKGKFPLIFDVDVSTGIQDGANDDMKETAYISPDYPIKLPIKVPVPPLVSRKRKRLTASLLVTLQNVKKKNPAHKHILAENLLTMHTYNHIIIISSYHPSHINPSAHTVTAQAAAEKRSPTREWKIHPLFSPSAHSTRLFNHPSIHSGNSHILLVVLVQFFFLRRGRKDPKILDDEAHTHKSNNIRAACRSEVSKSFHHTRQPIPSLRPSFMTK